MKNLFILFCSFLLNVVFGDTEVKVSVKEGDSVTLHINPQDLIDATDLEWRFKDTLIAKINIEKNKPPEYKDERFRDRLKLDRQTGSLNITNITSEDSGDYKMKIIGSGGIDQTFIVSVSVKSESVSVKVGNDFTLCHNTDIQGDDVIQWKFQGTLIVQSDRNPNISNDDGSFSGRLHLKGTECLIIKNFRSVDAGRYDVYITGSKHILHKRFKVTELPQTSPWKIGFFVLLVILLLLLGFSFIKNKCYRKR